MSYDYPFETEGTQEWLCAKTGASQLFPTTLAYRVRMGRVMRNTLIVEIVDTSKRFRRILGRCHMDLRYYRDRDIRELIHDCADVAVERMDVVNSRKLARQGEHPYFGLFRSSR